MKNIATILLQAVVVLVGIGILAALLVEPWVEGVNANATSLREIYFDDPFLTYIYVSFIAVFVGLYQTFKLFGYMRRNNVCSPEGERALRIIKYAAFTFAGLVAAAVAFLWLFNRGQDDIAGGVAMGLGMTVASILMAIVVGALERKTRKAL